MRAKEHPLHHYVGVDTRSWRGDTVGSILLREQQRLRESLPKLFQRLSKNRSRVRIRDDLMDSNGRRTNGLYERNEIQLSLNMLSNGPRRFRLGGAMFTDTSPQGVYRHELGHHVDEVYGRMSETSFVDALKQDMHAENLDVSRSSDRRAWMERHVSSYAAGNLSEAFAESVAAYTHADYGAQQRLPPNVDHLFRTTFGSPIRVKASRRARAHVRKRVRK